MSFTIKNQSKPAKIDCRFIAEWEHQAATLLTWPHAHGDWLPVLTEVEQTYTQLVHAIGADQPVIILCYDHAHQSHIEQKLWGYHGHALSYEIIPSNDTWIRDYGPMTVGCGSRRCFLNWIFNGWGNKFDATLDNAVNNRLFQGLFAGECHHDIAVVLEGGAVEGNGCGTLLTTERVISHPNRGNHLELRDWRQLFQEQLGIDRLIVLENGYLQGDDTDGHVDTLVRFINPHTLVYAATDDRHHPDYAELLRLQQELYDYRDTHGWQLLRLPVPSLAGGNAAVPANYLNFIFTNRGLIVPGYHVDEDQRALAVLREHLPGMTVKMVDSRVLVTQGGSLHCASMHIPAVAPAGT